MSKIYDIVCKERDTHAATVVKLSAERDALRAEIELERKIVNDLRLYLLDDLPALDWPKWEPDGVDSGPEDYACVVSAHGLKVICQHKGHEPMQDMCRKPDHDFCPVCMSLTPGQAKR